MLQIKYVQVLKGSIIDVAVDLRKESKTFGKWAGIYLSEENFKEMINKNSKGFMAMQSFAMKSIR